jgi:hypothetical protein
MERSGKRASPRRGGDVTPDADVFLAEETRLANAGLNSDGFVWNLIGCVSIGRSSTMKTKVLIVGGTSMPLILRYLPSNLTISCDPSIEQA